MSTDPICGPCRGRSPDTAHHSRQVACAAPSGSRALNYSWFHWTGLEQLGCARLRLSFDNANNSHKSRSHSMRSTPYPCLLVHLSPCLLAYSLEGRCQQFMICWAVAWQGVRVILGQLQPPAAMCQPATNQPVTREHMVWLSRWHATHIDLHCLQGPLLTVLWCKWTANISSGSTTPSCTSSLTHLSILAELWSGPCPS